MRKLNRAGFTLLELMAVMLIMFMLMGMATMSLRGLMRGTGFSGAVANVRSVVTQARQYAIMRGVLVEVRFTSNSMRMFQVPDQELTEARYLVPGIEFDPVPPSVFFNTDGTPGDTSGYNISLAELYIANPQNVDLEIDGMTGWVR